MKVSKKLLVSFREFTCIYLPQSNGLKCIYLRVGYIYFSFPGPGIPKPPTTTKTVGLRVLNVHPRKFFSLNFIFCP